MTDKQCLRMIELDSLLVRMRKTTQAYKQKSLLAEGSCLSSNQ